MKPLHPLIAGRWASKWYQPEPIPEDELASLFEAARWAPSSRNDQPWGFVIAPRTNAEAFGRLLSCLAEPNQAWAREAAALVAVTAAQAYQNPALPSKGQPNRHAWFDAGSAVAALSYQAVGLGLQLRHLGGIDFGKVAEAIKLPAGHDVVCCLALGRPKPGREAEAYKAQRARKPLGEVVFDGLWGNGWTGTS